MALAAAVIVLFAAAVVLSSMLIFGGRDGGSQPQTTLAAPPPVTTTETVTPSATSSSPTTTASTSAAPLSGVTGADGQGFVGHAARCDEGSSPVAMIRTSLSLAVVCETTPGTYYYHGERLRDGANVQLANATQSGAGFEATNPADGARYSIQPDMLTIISNGHVDSAEPALEYASR